MEALNQSENNSTEDEEVIAPITMTVNAGSSLLRPGSDAVPHMSRIEFIELSSCEVGRLNQFRTTGLIRIG